MRKALIVFVAVASVLLIAAFMYFIRPQPCDGIFEQTAPQLNVKLGFIEANGEWAIGKEKIQQVDKDSQDVALHLKTCCILQDKGSITPEQFQVCVNGAKEYEAKIIQITNIVGVAQEAKQQGKTELADQKAAEAKTVAGESTNVAGKVADDTKKLAQVVEKPSSATHTLNILAFDFERELFDEFLNIWLKRIDRERLVEYLQGAFLETGPMQDHAHARERAKMARLQFHDSIDVGHRAICVAGKKPCGRALISGFGPIGLQRDKLVEKRKRQRIVSRLHGNRCPLHEQICGIRIRLEPDALDGCGNTLRVAGVAGIAQAVKQPIENLLAHGLRRGLRRQGFLELPGRGGSEF